MKEKFKYKNDKIILKNRIILDAMKLATKHHCKIFVSIHMYGRHNIFSNNDDYQFEKTKSDLVYHQKDFRKMKKNMKKHVNKKKKPTKIPKKPEMKPQEPRPTQQIDQNDQIEEDDKIDDEEEEEYQHYSIVTEPDETLDGYEPNAKNSTEESICRNEQRSSSFVDYKTFCQNYKNSRLFSDEERMKCNSSRNYPQHNSQHNSQYNSQGNSQYNSQFFMNSLGTNNITKNILKFNNDLKSGNLKGFGKQTSHLDFYK